MDEITHAADKFRIFGETISMSFGDVSNSVVDSLTILRLLQALDRGTISVEEIIEHTDFEKLERLASKSPRLRKLLSKPPNEED